MTGKTISKADMRFYERQNLEALRQLERRFAHALTMREAVQNASQMEGRLDAIRSVIAKKEAAS